MMRESIHQDMATINIYALKAPKYIKQILTELKGELNNTITAGNFNSPFSTTDHPDRKSASEHWT